MASPRAGRHHLAMTAASRMPAPMLGQMGQATAVVALADGRIVWVNRACERLFGYDTGGLMTLHLSEITAVAAPSPGDRATAISRTVEAAGVWSGHMNGIRSDGDTFPCVVSVSEIADPASGERAWLAVFLEVDRRSATDSPAPPLQAVFDGAAVPMAVVGRDLRVADGNRALLALLGRPHHELVGRPVSDLIHPDLVSGQVEQLRRLLDGSVETQRGETQLFAADRTAVPVVITAALVRDLDQRALSALLVIEPAGGEPPR
jgi:PAS domain S-box-containing protein